MCLSYETIDAQKANAGSSGLKFEPGQYTPQDGREIDELSYGAIPNTPGMENIEMAYLDQNWDVERNVEGIVTKPLKRLPENKETTIGNEPPVLLPGSFVNAEVDNELFEAVLWDVGEGKASLIILDSLTAQVTYFSNFKSCTRF